MAGFSKISVREARSAFAETVRRANKGERVVVVSHDKPRAALVSIADLRLLRLIEARQDRMDATEIRKAKAEIAEQGAIPWDQIKAELGL